MSTKRRIVLFGLLMATACAWIVTVTCGGSSSSNATPASPTPSTYTLAGTVTDANSGKPLQGATVAVTSGPNADKQSSTDAAGLFSIANLLPGDFTVHATDAGYNAADKSVSMSSNTRVDFALQAAAPVPPPAPQCDASLWNHVHDVKRLKMVTACMTVRGVVGTDPHPSDDGDVDMGITPDPEFANLLNNANLTLLHGHLHVEAICQAPVHSDVPDAMRSCAGFVGTVTIPTLGAYVQVTGSYVLDQDHGWMEIHPATAIQVIR